MMGQKEGMVSQFSIGGQRKPSWKVDIWTYLEEMKTGVMCEAIRGMRIHSSKEKNKTIAKDFNREKNKANMKINIFWNIEVICISIDDYFHIFTNEFK